MPTFLDEGLQTAIYRLEVVAGQTANQSFVLRAKDLERRLTNQWFPVIEAPFIKGDAIALGEELATATGMGSGNPRNVLYDQDTTLGGPVGTVQQEAQVSGDVVANIEAGASDVGSSASELASNVAAAAPVVGHQLLIYLRWLLLALALLVVFYVYEKAKH